MKERQSFHPTINQAQLCETLVNMPKATRVPKHRGGVVVPVAKKIIETDPHVAAPPNGDDTANASVKNDALSRGQRKRQAKRDQYLKREQMVLASLKLKRADEQKKRIDGLDAIRDALLESVSHTNVPPAEDNAELPKDNMLRSNKSRQLLLLKETSQINLVLQHPSFQADSLGTLKEHLRNTVANEAKMQQKEAIKHAKEKVLKRAEKIALKKESGAKKKKNKFNATRSKSK
ncbi:hypothetical protein MPSEU_000113100 [Mayamaea pseudoterrestris]|nr:hypothetical protein MPSEU_000113100 [Mayamaea pseudoterrestris]